MSYACCDQSEMNVVLLGVSTSHLLLPSLAAISLLVLVALLWMNFLWLGHHPRPRRRDVAPVLVERQTPAQSLTWLSADFAVPMAARAPPTSIFPIKPLRPDCLDPGLIPGLVLPAAHVDDLLMFLR
jgi:hypothetical protein